MYEQILEDAIFGMLYAVVTDATPIDDSDAMDTMIATEEKEEADASLSRVGVAFWGCDSFRIVKSASKS